MARPRKFDQDTRAALVRETAEQIVAGGVASVSLRPLAAHHGCSTTAIYTMFGSRDGLIAEVGQEAVASFTRAQEAAPVLGDPVEDLLTLGRAYRKWALTSPALYGVMFGQPGTLPLQQGRADAPTNHRALGGLRAMRPLRRRVRECVAAGAFVDRPLDEICGSIRAGVHGWVTLETLHPVVAKVDAEVAYERHMLSILTAWSAGRAPTS